MSWRKGLLLLLSLNGLLRERIKHSVVTAIVGRGKRLLQRISPSAERTKQRVRIGHSHRAIVSLENKNVVKTNLLLNPFPYFILNRLSVQLVNI